MFNPKTYTLKNEMYDPKKDIRQIRQQIREWTNKLDGLGQLGDENIEMIFDNIITHIEDECFPMIDMQFYNEALEGWNLITRRNKLEKEYPREFAQVLSEERKEIRETLKMMKEDCKAKW
jgi:hypothetical protein